MSLTSFSQEINNKVSLIGDDEKTYESIILECPALLLQVTDNSMDTAFKLWTNMLSEMETSASAEGLDLRGMKIWINLFWEADGSIKKIVYYPKPNSKNMDFEKVTSFFQQFSKSYIIPIEHSSCFSHFGSAAFPVFRKLVLNNEK